MNIDDITNQLSNLTVAVKLLHEDFSILSMLPFLWPFLFSLILVILFKSRSIKIVKNSSRFIEVTDFENKAKLLMNTNEIITLHSTETGSSVLIKDFNSTKRIELKESYSKIKEMIGLG